MLRPFILSFALLTTPALAEPNVAADIAPVHSLVAAVMQGAGTPHLIVAPDRSPHHHSLTPSNARAIAGADLIFLTSAALTPWLPDSLAALAPDAVQIHLDATPGLTLLPIRTDPRFHHDGDDDHGHDHTGSSPAAAHGEEHSDEHHANHGEEHHATHTDHGEEHNDEPHHQHGEDHHAHDNNGATDPHLWLDPRNAMLWLDPIAQALAKADPDNAALYRRNADAHRLAISNLATRIDAQLASVRGKSFVVMHDAYHAFEHRFSVPAAGALSLGDAATPGIARLRAVRALIVETRAACVFAEPQYPDALIATVIEGTPARTAVLDPLGANLVPGPDLYPTLLQAITDGLTGCLAAP